MSKYSTIYELNINNKKYYVHKYILEKCQTLINFVELIPNNNVLHFDIPNLTIDFDLILTILYENKMDNNEYNSNDYIKIINTLDYLCYNNKEFITTLLHKIKPAIYSFFQIINLNIDDAHKGILINHFIDNIYSDEKYISEDVIIYLNFLHLMDTQLKDKIFKCIALKIDSIDTINNLALQILYKNILLKYYIVKYSSHKKIIIKVHEFSNKFEQKDDNLNNLKILQFYQDPETHQGFHIDCSDIPNFLNGLKINFNNYTLRYFDNKMSLYINKEYIGRVSKYQNYINIFYVNEILQSYAISQLIK